VASIFAIHFVGNSIVRYLRDTYPEHTLNGVMQCEAYINGTKSLPNEPYEVFDVSLDKAVTLNADAQALLAQVHHGEINSINDLTYSLSLNAQKNRVTRCDTF